MHAAVLGSPVGHSRSPVLHRAAYDALGLRGWTYEAIECRAEELPAFVRGRDGSWAGLSVTMPGKRAALAVASTAPPRARRLGTANTLARRPDGSWAADCTDVDGVVGALRVAGVREPGAGAAGEGVDGVVDGVMDGVMDEVMDEVLVLGNGATAAAALGGIHLLGGERVTVVARDAGRAVTVLEVARSFGLARRAVTWHELVPGDLARATALINTTPAGSVDPGRAAMLVGELPEWAVVLDAVYHPWPTPLAAAARARGLPVATGLDMLLHQAFGQVEQFTGAPAPRAAMFDALAATSTDVPLLPLLV